ncbi:MAG TPA: class I SAM-dependent methyltransferase [Cytophagales bacterium]|nr:class I SAM-dependent methyltransferase [Cytophagales bacterium]
MDDYNTSKEVSAFIEKHKAMPVADVVLKLHSKSNLPKEFIINQINGLQKLKSKLPEWQHVEGLVFPPKVSFEQCSSSDTAAYKSQFVKGMQCVVDLTGGFGVDAYYFSKKADHVIYVEQSKQLSKLYAHNLQVLKASNVEVVNQTCEDWLTAPVQMKVDLVYVDPARRGSDNQKLYKIEDCEPNVIELIPLIWHISEKAMIKFSPMIDLTSITRHLNGLKEIHVVSVKNECKEVLALLEHDYVGDVPITCIDIKSKAVQKFVCQPTVAQQPIYSEPQQYLYEPNASLMKAQCFDALASAFKIPKLSAHSHLYTSEGRVFDFPGRTFKIIGVCDYSEKVLKSSFKGLVAANVTVRNFGESVADVRAKLKLKDGGNIYIFATSTVLRKKLLVICEPL